MHVIAFVHNGYLEVQISVQPAVAVNGKCQLVCVEHFLKHGVQAETGMARACAIVAHA
jgi:hypothetical protein